MKKFLTEKQERAICNAYKAGKTRLSLAAKYGCSACTVGRIVAKNLTPRERKRRWGRQWRRFTDKQELQICEAYKKGGTQYTLATQFKCSRAVVGDALHKHLSKATMRRLIHRNRSRMLRGPTRSASWRRSISRSLIRRNIRGPDSPLWKGGRHYNGSGYIRVYTPKHPRSTNDSVFEHRLVMEKHLGRYLRRNEWIHHRNGRRDDNRLENLQIVTHSNHRGVVKCPYCNKTYALH